MGRRRFRIGHFQVAVNFIMKVLGKVREGFDFFGAKMQPH